METPTRLEFAAAIGRCLLVAADNTREKRHLERAFQVACGKIGAQPASVLNALVQFESLPASGALSGKERSA